MYGITDEIFKISSILVVDYFPPGFNFINYKQGGVNCCEECKKRRQEDDNEMAAKPDHQGANDGGVDNLSDKYLDTDARDILSDASPIATLATHILKELKGRRKVALC